MLELANSAFIPPILFANITITKDNLSTSSTLSQIESLDNEKPRDQYYSEYFGYVKIHTSSNSYWTITNSGDENIELVSAKISGTMFNGSTNCNKLLKPKDKCQLRIGFSPFIEGTHFGYLDLVFDKGSNLYFDMWGHGSLQ